MASIVLVSQRLLGHVLPAVAIGVELRKRGHSVTVLGSRTNRELILRYGLNFAEIGWDKYPDLYADRMLAELLPLLREMRPQLILTDSAQCAPAYAAELLGIRWASFQTSIPLAEQWLPGRAAVNAGLRKAYAKELNRVRAQFGLGRLEAGDLRTRGDCAGISPELHLVTVLPELVEGLAELHPQTRIIGPCEAGSPGVPDARGGLFGGDDPAREAVLIPPGEGPLVLVTATSVPRAEYRIATDRYIRAALDAFRDSACRLVISEQRPYKDVEPLPENIRWTTYQPIHKALLPLTDVLVTHGGCGTLQTAMSSGVPMIIVPLGADHPLLARRCEELGIAVTLDAESVDAGAIRQAVNRVTGDPSYRKKALERAEIRKTISPAQTGADYLEQLLHHHF
ncbi:glycosyltransferase [Paenibacillus chitinolyticus]|uniref:glycosyltransferase n=1 Tax=Paenibacillus chitinolyticus TaxID=79263 RepID=UPI0036565048